MASEDGSKRSVMEKISTFIVDKRKAFYLVYIVIAIFCIISSDWVEVNNTLTDYLSEDTETRQGLTLMEDEFTTYASADIMVDNVSYEKAQSLAAELRKNEGVKDIEFDDTDKHYAGGSALFSITFDGSETDDISFKAFKEVKEKLSDYDVYTSAEFGDARAELIAKEINVVMIIACVIILLVLLLTSRTYMEIPVMVLTFGMAAIMNKGTNFIFGKISFISNSVAVILQLALAIDYAIILCHRYTEERATKDAREAVITALCKAIPEISGSCLTTLSGLLAMTFMHFRIGYDMGITLIKAILLSILSVFTFMPGLLMTFSKLIEKTPHRNFIPDISIWAKIVEKLRYITPMIFGVIVVVSFFFCNHCPYAYSYSLLSTIRKNDSQIADNMISQTFNQTNQIALLVPRGDYDKEKALLEDLEAYSEVDSAVGLANTEARDGYAVTDKLTPRQFSELTDMDIEIVRLVYSAYALKQDNYGRIAAGINDYGVPLLDMFDFLYEQTHNGTFTVDDDLNEDLEDIHSDLEDGKKQLLGENYSRLVLELNLPEESDETFAFLDTIKGEAKKYYGDGIYLVGNSTSDFDLSATFGQDNLLISILSALFVMLILLFTFRSAGIPIILIIVIEGSIWMNFSFPFMQNKPLFFLSYLVVSSIQMGANIDYAIVVTNRYQNLRHEGKETLAAARDAIVQAFPTILTSGSILAAAGIVIGILSTDAAISSIGVCLGRGTLISILLVMLILPQLLILGDKIIEKTSFSVKDHVGAHSRGGSMYVDGKIHGMVNGRLDGSFTGIVNGDIDAIIVGGSKNKLEKANNDE